MWTHFSFDEWCDALFTWFQAHLCVSYLFSFRFMVVFSQLERELRYRDTQLKSQFRRTFSLTNSFSFFERFFVTMSVHARSFER